MRQRSDGCCVSDLLRDEPLIRSGRDANYEKGKDTGRFWDAGAANVHWVIVGEDQVEAGINEALSRVKSAGVVVEGNSFLDYVEADFAIMCARAGENKLKTSARGLWKRLTRFISRPSMIQIERRQSNSSTHGETVYRLN